MLFYINKILFVKLFKQVTIVQKYGSKFPFYKTVLSQLGRKLKKLYVRELHM
jgi:hypothetical protein